MTVPGSTHNTAANVIIVGDTAIRLLTHSWEELATDGHQLFSLTEREAGDASILEHLPDLVLLGHGTPQATRDSIRAIRERSDVPIVAFSGPVSHSEIVQALDAGADDYISSPFFPEEVRARTRSLLRRAQPRERSHVLTVGDARIDFALRNATLEHPHGPIAIRLTPTEWRLLELLARRPGALVTRETLLQELRGGIAVDTGYLRRYIAQLRTKLDLNRSNPDFLITEPGMGYRLRVNAIAGRPDP